MTVHDLPTLSRALSLDTFDGRTFEGTAYSYGHPSPVVDQEGRYLEQFAPGCDRKTIRDRAGTFPLLVWHSRSVNRGKFPPEEIGTVEFEVDADRLRYQAVLDRGPVADEMCSMVHDGTAGDVSVSFAPLRSFEHRVGEQGVRLVTRTEIALRELSLAPAGTAVHESSSIDLVRALAEPDLDDEPEVDLDDIDVRLRLLRLR